jgi:hypothetical protein
MNRKKQINVLSVLTVLALVLVWIGSSLVTLKYIKTVFLGINKGLLYQQISYEIFLAPFFFWGIIIYWLYWMVLRDENKQ